MSEPVLMFSAATVLPDSRIASYRCNAESFVLLQEITSDSSFVLEGASQVSFGRISIQSKRRDLAIISQIHYITLLSTFRSRLSRKQRQPCDMCLYITSE